MDTLVLGLGNDLLADDGIGIYAARALAAPLQGRADVQECSICGIALMEIFTGFQRVVVIDAIQTGSHPPGTILVLVPADLDAVVAPSPHYAGLPEMFALATQLGLDFPREFVIFAMEVQDPYTVGGDMTPLVAAALPELVQRVLAQVEAWEKPAP